MGWGSPYGRDQHRVSIWLARRRDKGRPAPGWERIWAAVVWGQPLALAVAGLGAPLAEQGVVLPAYLAVTVLALCVCAVLGSSVTIGRALRLLTAAALVGVVAAHAQMWGGKMGDPTAWGVSAAIVACALVWAARVWDGGSSMWVGLVCERRCLTNQARWAASAPHPNPLPQREGDWAPHTTACATVSS